MECQNSCHPEKFATKALSRLKANDVINIVVVFV